MIPPPTKSPDPPSTLDGTGKLHGDDGEGNDAHGRQLALAPGFSFAKAVNDQPWVGNPSLLEMLRSLVANLRKTPCRICPCHAVPYVPPRMRVNPVNPNPEAKTLNPKL